MDQNEDPHELERQIERAKRLASRTTDQTTYQRLSEFVEELRQSCNGASLQGGRRKRSERVPANFGSITAGPGAGTWSSGCRQKQS
jgi:hypothetical protein